MPDRKILRKYPRLQKRYKQHQEELAAQKLRNQSPENYIKALENDLFPQTRPQMAIHVLERMGVPMKNSDISFFSEAIFGLEIKGNSFGKLRADGIKRIEQKKGIIDKTFLIPPIATETLGLYKQHLALSHWELPQRMVTSMTISLAVFRKTQLAIDIYRYKQKRALDLPYNLIRFLKERIQIALNLYEKDIDHLIDILEEKTRKSLDSQIILEVNEINRAIQMLESLIVKSEKSAIFRYLGLPQDPNNPNYIPVPDHYRTEKRL